MNPEQTLQQVFGHGAFREGQRPLIDALLAGHDALGVMPTGAGKSVCYQIPALILDGVTLVVSPLISLMKDQVAALRASGVAAAYINSSLTAPQQAEAIRRAALGLYKIIYVAPERLDVPDFVDFARAANVSLLAVDEAHCVSQWGQDFRPSYLRIADFIAKLPVRPPLGAFTATATPVVRGDIVRMLGLRDPLIVTTGFDRPNLRFISIKPKDKYAALLDVVRRHPEQSGIVYCATRKAVEEVCARLERDGVSATRYHAGLSERERRDNQDDFRFERALVMVATNAFGMGIDKSNVYYVVHYNMPKNIESYYQEAGRAGRDGEDAECVLLYAGQDVITARWLIEHAEENPDLTDGERAELRARDLQRLRDMTFYATSKYCLRKAILKYFGETAPEDCGNCSVCMGLAFETGKPRRGEAVERDDRAIPAEPRAPGAKTRKGASGPDEALYQKLKALRKELAGGMPAYAVLTDKTLREMARLRPTTAEAFLSVPGIGHVKRERYGEAFMAVIREETKGAPGGQPPTQPKKQAAAQAYAPWGDEEEKRLQDEYARGEKIRQIAKAHGRTRGAITARLKKLGLYEE